MPTTVRTAIFATDPEAGLENNLDFVSVGQTARHERWSIFGNQPAIEFYWPTEGEMNLFLQLWQPQPAIAEAPFRVTCLDEAGPIGWDFMVPQVGRVMLLLRKPRVTDIIRLYADQFTVEVDGIFY